MRNTGYICILNQIYYLVHQKTGQTFILLDILSRSKNSRCLKQQLFLLLTLVKKVVVYTNLPWTVWPWPFCWVAWAPFSSPSFSIHSTLGQYYLKVLRHEIFGSEFFFYHRSLYLGQRLASWKKGSVSSIAIFAGKFFLELYYCT